jgi:hypothetical protein
VLKFQSERRQTATLLSSTKYIGVHDWTKASERYKEELASLPKRARHMISMVDSFVGTDEIKNKAKNLLGRVDLMQSIYRAYEQDEQLGILSPLARPTSTSSGMIEKKASLSFQDKAESEWGNVFIPKEKHGIFRSLLELNQEIPVSKEAWPLTQEEADKLKQTYYRDILQSRGCECCCLNDCPEVSGLSVIRVKLGAMNGESGVCIMCQAHLNQLCDTQSFTLPKDAHMFIL